MSAVPVLEEIDGFPIPAAFSAESFRAATKYTPRPDDLFLVTYPKCGTTWTGQILLLILQKGEPIKSPSDLHSRAPFLEMGGVKCVENMAEPGPIKTHLPFRLTPWSKDAKYICVSRNPKDCCVSYFHHMKNMPGRKFEGTFDEFFELFMSGKTEYGDYFDHLLSWYPHRNDPNVLFVTYEELKGDIDAAILKMASFIDDEKYAKPIREDPKILENIKKYSSVKEMKEFMTKCFTEIANMTPEEVEKSSLPDGMKEVLKKARAGLKFSLERKEGGPDVKKGGPDVKKGGPDVTQFVRKGIVGDWRNHLSEDQSRRLDEKFAERTKGTDISSFWKQYMQ